MPLLGRKDGSKAIAGSLLNDCSAKVLLMNPYRLLSRITGQIISSSEMPPC